MNSLAVGDYFGELALLDDSARSYGKNGRALSVSDCQKEDFQKSFDNPGITQHLLGNLAARL